MMQSTIFNIPETYAKRVDMEIGTTMPQNAVFAVKEGEFIVPTIMPSEYTPVEELERMFDDVDMAVIEEVARSKYLNSLQIYELLSLRGFLIQRDRLTKRLNKLKKYRVIRENTIKLPETEHGLRYYELELKGYVIAKNRGCIFHKGNRYISYMKRVELGLVDLPSDVKRVLCGNQIVIHMLINNIKMQRFGILETYCAKNEEGLVTDCSILRTAANIKIDANSILAYEVVRDNPEGYEKLADKIDRYYTLLHNENYLLSNHHDDREFPQLVICGQSFDHNKRIVDFLKKKGLWSDEDTILFTEDLLNIRDSARSIYEIKGNERVWYRLPVSYVGDRSEDIKYA